MSHYKGLNRWRPLTSSVGLVPHMHNSGETEITGGLTTRGNKRLKTILIKGIQKAVRQDPALMLAYNKLSRRMNANKAIIRICKKMLRRMDMLLIHREPYEMAVS
ncbi:MAG: transposase [Cyclobacteriaceae bacterium]|nr:transposase [Cyclobacteriaceae bacterium]